MISPYPIVKAEEEYLKLLEDFFRRKWGETILWSHDLSHHRRVWIYAKELLPFYPVTTSPEASNLPEKLIIASFLHDIGMSSEAGIRHGLHGKKICKQFLAENDLDEAGYRDVLEAIEYHDKKDYREAPGGNDILNLLSVADDLDAFGHIGIFRYSEIYLTRHTGKLLIGRMIRKNADGRFKNFRNIFRESPELISRHEIRYRILDNFFAEYNLNATLYNFNATDPGGYCGVVETIEKFINKGLNYQDLTSAEFTSHKDPVIKWFFTGFEKELEESG